MDQRALRHAITSALALFVSVQTFHAQVAPTRRPPAPFEPVTAILDAFKTYDIVALSEPHGNEQAYELRLKLLRDRRFPSVVNDLVIEAGNARYQDLIDRFTRGEPVSDEALRHVWQDIVTPGP